MTSEKQSGMPSDLAPIGFAKHDHSSCVEEALNAAHARCEANDLRLTPVRRKVLEILLREHRALGAYAILDLLSKDGFGSQPPVAYRALAFLAKHGFVHKIERLNAFVACAHPGANHSPAFMICRKCEAVAEANSSATNGAFGEAAEAAGFHVERTIVEAEGICPACAEDNT